MTPHENGAVNKLGREHDFDPVTWKCRKCTVRATEGLVVCHPHPDQAAE